MADIINFDNGRKRLGAAEDTFEEKVEFEVPVTTITAAMMASPSLPSRITASLIAIVDMLESEKGMKRSDAVRVINEHLNWLVKNGMTR